MDNSQPLPDDFLQFCRSITAKRPKVVIDHILQYGFITTEDLKDIYGYSHAPRAARDVRELGILLETFRVTGNDTADRKFSVHVQNHKILSMKDFNEHRCTP
jgi:hypothetical protein